jgi:uncharacterized membrane protein YraQ (UPF0718 family)
VVRHFSKGRFKSVFKAAILGIPMPLCSCGVLPAAVALRKRGANKGATTAFLISTPESGVDSIAITYALLDPIMTVARPLAAFVTATAAGITENLVHYRKTREPVEPDLSCSVDACCDGLDCPPEEHARHHSLSEKIVAGFRFALTEVWGDMAGWFLIGLVIAGAITTAIPEDVITRYLGGGLPSMLFMLAVGIPLYICATASTPIAAALILKGISPGAALVFLMAGPATNITSLTVLLGTLGKRATAIYLSTIALSSVLFGLTVDRVYEYLGFSARAVVGQAAEIIPNWAQWMGALILLVLSVKPIWMRLKSRFVPGKPVPAASCSTETCSDLGNSGIAGTGDT